MTIIRHTWTKVWNSGKLNHKKKDTGRLWVLENDSLFEKDVTIGLSDGTTTEVSGDIAEGTIVITGMNTVEQTTQQSQNPFMPKMPSPRNAPKKK